MDDQLPDLSEYLTRWREDLNNLRQNELLTEGAFITFAKDRDVPVVGVMTGDPGQFVARGWLKSDQGPGDTRSLFHPFRIYPLDLILRDCRLPIAASATLQRDRMLELVAKVLQSRPNLMRIEQMAIKANRLVDLAILLEPNYATLG